MLIQSAIFPDIDETAIEEIAEIKAIDDITEVKAEPEEKTVAKRVIKRPVKTEATEKKVIKRK